MIASRGVKYEHVWQLVKFSRALTDSTGNTVSGRLQSWLDVDGTLAGLPGGASAQAAARFRGQRTQLGSTWAGNWWRYSAERCEVLYELHACAMRAGDFAASPGLNGHKRI